MIWIANPDDAELITEEWLEQIGFKWEPCRHDDSTIELRLGGLKMFSFSSYKMVALEGADSYEMKTRGDVLRLCEALRIKTAHPLPSLIDWCDEHHHSIKGLLCSAFEGGSNYWYRIESYELPPGTALADFSEGGKFQDPNDYWHPTQLLPLTEGGAVMIGVPEEPERGQIRLDRAAIERGLRLMLEKHPRHWADFYEGDDDATTGDVFLQLCLFGEVIFG